MRNEDGGWKIEDGEYKVAMITGLSAARIYRALSMRTGTLMWCWTRLAVAPGKRAAANWGPGGLLATRSQPFWWTHLMISLTGSPKANSLVAGIPAAVNSDLMVSR